MKNPCMMPMPLLSAPRLRDGKWAVAGRTEGMFRPCTAHVRRNPAVQCSSMWHRSQQSTCLLDSSDEVCGEEVHRPAM